MSSIRKNRAKVNPPANDDGREPDVDPFGDDAYFVQVADQSLEQLGEESPSHKPDSPDGVLVQIIDKMLETDRPGFPLYVFPSPIRDYLRACASSIHCPIDLLAVPLLAVAGAANRLSLQGNGAGSFQRSGGKFAGGYNSGRSH